MESYKLSQKRGQRNRRADKFRAGYPDRVGEKKIYSIRGSQLRRVAEKPIRIRVPAMMDCWSYGKLSVKHNIDPRSLRPTPRNRTFTLAAGVRPRIVLSLSSRCGLTYTFLYKPLPDPPFSSLFLFLSPLFWSRIRDHFANGTSFLHSMEPAAFA